MAISKVKAIIFSWTILLSAAVGSVRAAEYSLLFFENDSFRDYSYAEFFSSIGMDARLLDYYRCDGKREYETIRPLPVENPERDSLRIQEEKNNEPIVYREGRLFRTDGTPVDRIEGVFGIAVMNALTTLESAPSAARLLRLIERARFPITITYGKWVSFNPRRLNGLDGLPFAASLIYPLVGRFSKEYSPLDEIGSGGRLIWNPEEKGRRIESDGEIRMTPNFVILMHEMYHAYDGVRGVLDRRWVWAPGEMENAEVCEYRAMYFENQLRKELGLRYAAYYGSGPFGEPGILDKNGRPILMPSPCLGFRK